MFILMSYLILGKVNEKLIDKLKDFQENQEDGNIMSRLCTSFKPHYPIIMETRGEEFADYFQLCTVLVYNKHHYENQDDCNIFNLWDVALPKHTCKLTFIKAFAKTQIYKLYSTTELMNNIFVTPIGNAFGRKYFSKIVDSYCHLKYKKCAEDYITLLDV